MSLSIQEIKRRNPIAVVVTEHGVPLRQQGETLKGRCPFHQDDTPSFTVYPKTRSFYCFGCGVGGDVIDFVRRANGVSFREAVNRLSGRWVPVRTKANPEKSLSLDDRMILTAACAVYHEALLATPVALKYLESRGIGIGVVKQCRLGFSNGGALRVYLERRRMSLKRAREMGLLWRDVREALAGRIIIPELRGAECVWMIGRSMGDGREPKYRGLSLPKPLLGYERVRGRPRVVLAEGAFDYLTGVSWNLSICALLGTHARADRLGFLERAQEVLICLDNDEPGKQAANELASRLGVGARVLSLPDGVKDLNELGKRPDGRALFFRLLNETEGSDREPAQEKAHVVVPSRS